MDFKRAYEILEIDESASFPEIKQAYRDLASIWHPDRHSNNSRLAEKALQKIKEINAAYDLLSTWHTEIDRSKSRERQKDEFTIVKCKICGAQNRIKNIVGVAFKCGKCHHNLFDEQTYSDDSEGFPCGDGECIGIIRNGRCTVCGKTLEEGLKEDQIKTKYYQEQYNKRAKETEKKKNYIKYFIVSALVIFFIYAILNDNQNKETKHISNTSNPSKVSDFLNKNSLETNAYQVREIELASHNFSAGDIENLQKNLKSMGYNIGHVDGVIGSKTIEGCNNFIKDFRLFSNINSIDTFLNSIKIHSAVAKTYTEWPNIVRDNLLENWVMKQPTDFRDDYTAKSLS